MIAPAKALEHLDALELDDEARELVPRRQRAARVRAGRRRRLELERAVAAR